MLYVSKLGSFLPHILIYLQGKKYQLKQSYSMVVLMSVNAVSHFACHRTFSKSSRPVIVSQNQQGLVGGGGIIPNIYSRSGL